MRAIGASARLGSLVALAAGLSGGLAAAQTGPAKGSFPGSILIPGSETSFKVGGYVKGDYAYDFSAQENIIGGLNPGAIPLDNNAGPPGSAPQPGHSIHGTSQFTASESRFNIETRTPTAYGELRTFLEGDFTDSNGATHSKTFQLETNSTGLRLRYAYGALGPLLVGQYNSAFRDQAAEPETLDFNGPIVAGALRQPQVRYTFALGNGLRIAVAAENPELFTTDATNATTPGGATNSTFGTGQGDKAPDLAIAATWELPRGHVALRGIFRDLYDHDGTGLSQSKFGWGLGVSGDFRTWGKDDIIFQVNGGDGAGRYLNSFSALVPDVAVDVAANRMKTIKGWGAELGYEHWWTGNLRSTVVASYLEEDNPSGIFTPAALAVQSAHWWTAHVNLIWSPISLIDTGIEYIHENRTIEDGRSGDINRVQLSTKFKF